MRMVAPTEPVPLRRNTTREPSTMRMRIPCREATDPSTGSLYSNSSAFAIEKPVEREKREHQKAGEKAFRASVGFGTRRDLNRHTSDNHR